MSREDSEYTVGEYWLDFRRDGKAKGIYQITRYSPESRSDVYRSARTRDLDEAIAAIIAHAANERAEKPQVAEVAEVVPQIQLYWKEHGSRTRRPDTVAGSLRAFIGFLMQDKVTVRATVGDLTPALFVRFRDWRMGPHSYSVTWNGKLFPVTSQGVRGESVQRNLDDVRAALNHAAENGRIPYAPKVPSVPSAMRSPPRDVRVSIGTLGAMVGFAQGADDKAFLRWLLLMIGTAVRPEAGALFDPERQYHGDLIDLHPSGQPRTKKRNPSVPAIRQLQLMVPHWPAPTAKGHRTAWRTMRRALGLPANVIPKTIRHTIATELRRRGVPGEQISGLLGHTAMSRITEVYAKYDPRYLGEAKAVLTTIFRDVLRARKAWLADHVRTKQGNAATKVIARKGGEV